MFVTFATFSLLLEVGNIKKTMYIYSYWNFVKLNILKLRFHVIDVANCLINWPHKAMTIASDKDISTT